MNEDRQMELHYTETGFPYTSSASESFMNFFEGLTQVPTPLTYPHPGLVHHDQEGYWSMNMNSYKFGFSGPGSTTSTSSYYGHYEVNDHLPRMDMNRRAWEYPSMMNTDELSTTDSGQFEEESSVDADAAVVPPTPEENIIPNQQNSNASSSQTVWQDGIDPDNMTYEELLDLGETVGTQSRGLSDDLINLLPTSKYKFGSFFSRKKSGERCVICQMRYKRGDRQMKLPCKHLYHSECISKWLSINKVCPVCNMEVFGEELS